MLSKGNHKETLLKTQGLTLGILLPLQVSFFSYILFFIVASLLLLLLSSNFTALYPGWFYRNLSWCFVVVVVFLLLLEASSDGSPEIPIARGIPVPTDVWPADLKISLWIISFLLCAWSVTHSHPNHPPLQVPDPTVNGW